MSRKEVKKFWEDGEIRSYEDGIDEIVCSCSFFHLEQMDDGHWWIGITDKTGKNVSHIHLGTKRGAKIICNAEIDTGGAD